MLFLVITLLSTSGFNGVYGDWYSLGGEYGGKTSVTARDYSMEGLSVDVTVPGFEMLPANGYTRLRLVDREWDLDLPPGFPELPMVPLAIGLPSGMGAEVSSVDVTWVSVGDFRVHPVQPLEYDCPGERPAFVELSSELHGIHPAEAVVIDEMGSLFGVDVARVVVNPFRWNADTGLLEAASTVSVNIAFTGSPGFQIPVRPETARILRSMLLNFDEMGIPLNNSPVTSEDVVYIVLTVEENLPEITPLLSMVHLLGYRVVIEVFETTPSAFVIRSTILSHFQPGITRFVLIAGTHQELPSFNFGSFVGDFFYQTLDGDNLPDIAVGRFPGGEGLLTNMVEKSMAYSNFTGTPGEPSIPAITMLCAHEEEYPLKYTYNKNQIMNWNYSIMNPVFHTFYPPEGATQQQVKDMINAGVGTVNYRGHGSVTTWQWSPGWNAGAIYSLENTFFPPVFNIACDNGKHDVTYQCLCKSWLYAQGRGASGTCGASAPSATTVNHTFDRAIYWQLYDEGNTCAAEMHAAAQATIILNHGSSGINNARMYHWFGDPSMDIFNCDETGSPFPMEIECPEYAYHGANSMVLTVTSLGLPVQGAVVTASDGIGNHTDHPETFYAQGITDATGQTVLEFTAQGGSTVNVGARMHNLTPAFETIYTYPEGVHGDEAPVFVLLPASPNPSAYLVTLGMDLPSAGMYDLSIFDLSGRLMDSVCSGHLEPGQHRFSYSTEPLSPGLYFVMLRGGGITATTNMLVVGR